MTRYQSNIQVSTSLRELEILRQEDRESFTNYLSRWKATAAQMVSPPEERELVKIFVNNLQPRYRNHLRYLGLNTFDQIYRIGIEIEDDLLEEIGKSKWGGYQKNDMSNTSMDTPSINVSEQASKAT